MLKESVSKFWPDIIEKAATPWGIFALVVLMMGTITLAFVTPKDSVMTRFSAFIVSVLFFLCVIVYNPQGYVTNHEPNPKSEPDQKPEPVSLFEHDGPPFWASPGDISVNFPSGEWKLSPDGSKVFI